MDKQDRKIGGEVLIFPTVLLGLLIITDWALRARLITPGQEFYNVTGEIIRGFRDNHFYVRLAFVIIVSLNGLASRRPSIKQINPFITGSVAAISTAIFVYGFRDYLLWNLYIYPMAFLFTAYFVNRTFMYIDGFKKSSDKSLKDINKGKDSEVSFLIPTKNYGNMHLPLPTYGSYIEGAAGSGKSVLIEQIMNQAIRKNFSMFLYDFEGDVTEQGAILSKNVYASLLEYKGSKNLDTGFAFMNFKDPSRSIRCNPLSPKYIKSELDIMEFATTLMTNLNPDWRKNRDFWADNAIAYATGIILKLWMDKDLHKYLTIPHLVSICTKNYSQVFNWILDDPDNTQLERTIMPLYVAYQEKAKSQLAGAVSSAALPITKLFTKDIYWPLSPEEGEDFSLDITNRDSPVCFCVGTIPSQKHSLGPVVSLIALVCMNNMNQLDKHKSLFILDELPTVTIPNLDYLPATARKKGVCAMFAVQSFKQLEESYGKEKAEVIRDNLSNQFVFSTNSVATAERMVKIFGKKDKFEYSQTEGDSSSQTRNVRKEEVLQARDVMTQMPGHCTGKIVGGNPSLFHTQFKYFEIEKPDIPKFSNFINTGDEKLDQDLMLDRVQQNFDRINKEVDDLLGKYSEDLTE